MRSAAGSSFTAIMSKPNNGAEPKAAAPVFNAAETAWLRQVLQRDFAVTPLQGGANNQGFCVSTDTQRFFLKRFADSDSAKQKLEQEQRFATVLYQHGIRHIPQPLAQHSALRLSLFSFIEGTPVRQLQAWHLAAALDFVRQINQPNLRRQLQSPKPALTLAAESPATLADFCHIVERRLQRLSAVVGQASDCCQPALQQLLTDIGKQLTALSQDLPASWQWPLDRSYLSPSDFGFHNAIEREHSLYFIDFEYAGCDSLWKLFSDFFAQPAVPVPLHYAAEFLRQPLFDELAQQPATLLQIYQLTQLKWSLLMLNEFLPEVMARRLHSLLNKLDQTEPATEFILSQQQAQLAKSQRYFQQIAERTHQLKQGLAELS